MRRRPWAPVRRRRPPAGGWRRRRHCGGEGSGNVLAPGSPSGPQRWIRLHAAFGPVATMKTTELPQPLHCGCPHLSIAHCRWTCAVRVETEDAPIFCMTSAVMYQPRGFKSGKAWLSAAWAVIRCAAGHRTSRCTHGLRAVGEP
jgi:hypothetical protein